MSKVLGGSSSKPPPPPPPPDPAIARKAAEQTLSRKKAEEAERGVRGRASTILTSGQGLLDDGSESRRRLL